jgi:hypothetical protein
MATHPPNVSAFYVSLVARDPKDEDLATPPIEVLVDTGSELSWLPRNVLEQIGLVPRRRCSFARRRLRHPHGERLRDERRHRPRRAG